MAAPATQVLYSGWYLITSVSANLNISRSPVEDRSLLPKKVVTLANGTPWYITRNPDGTYTLQNKGPSPAVDISGKLFAQLQEQTPSLEKRWRITSVAYQGADQFIIENISRTKGWQVPNTAVVAENTHVDVLPLISTRSLPPQYPAFERFILTRVG
ncbi:hypothetical protein ABW19_dt0207678 [Dactylella cylindrospora]|nr:hypothetical protein ABW19_dt0207678 [Dactylella cylindrospora]